MTRAGVYSRSDAFLRDVARTARAGGALSVDVRVRSERELSGTSALDVLIVDGATVNITDELIERAGSVPVAIVDRPADSDALARVWSDRADGWADVIGGDLERLLAAAVAAAFGLVVEERDAGAEHTETREEPGQASGLTPREREVLELVARGRTNREIAGDLGVSANTVKYHLAGLFAKLDASTRSEAIWIAARRGLIAL